MGLSSPKSLQSDPPKYTWCPVRGLTPPGHLSSVTPNFHHSVLADCPGSSLLSLSCSPCSSGQKGEAEPCGAMTLGWVSPGASYLCCVRGHRGHQAVGTLLGTEKGFLTSRGQSKSCLSPANFCHWSHPDGATARTPQGAKSCTQP